MAVKKKCWDHQSIWNGLNNDNVQDIINVFAYINLSILSSCLQTRGFAVVADKLNFLRYMSHFRAVHRGSYFTEMRTTSVRKLLPEAWGESEFWIWAFFDE